jgi:hypothetical protein
MFAQKTRVFCVPENTGAMPGRGGVVRKKAEQLEQALILAGKAGFGIE